MTLKKKIKGIVTFFGQELNIFLKKLFMDLVILLGTLVLIIGMAFLNQEITGDLQITILVSLAILVASQIVRSRTSLRHDFNIHQAYRRYLKGKASDDVDFIKTKNLFRETRRALKSAGKKLSKKTVLGMSGRYSPHEIISIDRTKIKILKRETLKHTLRETGTILFICLPFLAVLLLYAAHTSLAFLIFLLIIGILFILFLHAALIRPLFNLLLENKIGEIMSIKAE